MKLTSLIFLVALMAPAGNNCCANISDPGPPNLNRLDVQVKVYVNSKVIRVTNLNRKGKIIDSQEEVGGYPEVKPTYRKLEVPSDNLERWLNDLAVEVQE